MDKRKSVLKRVSVLGQLKLGRQRKALANPNDDFNLIQERTGLSIQNIKLVNENFQNFVQNGSVQQDKVAEILAKSNLSIDEYYKEKIYEEIQRLGVIKLDLIQVCQVYVAMKNKIQLDIEEANNAEYIDAFVAMGGDPDRQGTISRQTIIDIIKVTFELTFDIEEFMMKQEVNSEQLDFEQFCMLFDQNMQESRSIISGISRKFRENNNDIEHLILGKQQDREKVDESFNVDYKEFQRWLIKEDNKEY